MSEPKPEDTFAEGLNAPSDAERHTEFTDRADALLRWKQKTAAKGKLSEMEKHTSKCGDCGMKMKKCACAATKTAAAKVAYIGPENIIGGLIGYSKGKQQKARGEEHSFKGKQLASLLIPGGAGYQVGRHMGHRKETATEKTAQDWRINPSTDRPIFVKGEKGAPKAFLARGEEDPQLIHGMRGISRGGRPVAAAFSVQGKEGPELRVAEPQGAAKGGRRVMGVLGGLGGLAAAPGLVGSGTQKSQMLRGLASVGGGAALGALGGHAMGRSHENRLRGLMKLPKKGFFGGDPLEDATARSQAAEEIKTKSDRMAAQQNKAREIAKVKTAFINAVGPTSAASSVNAREGELVVKTAGTKETAKRVLQFIKTNPYARDAVVSGTAGAAMGAASAPPGTRTRGAIRGGFIGAGGGLVAGEMFRHLQKNAEMEDSRAVLAGKLPEKGLPKPALEKDIEDIKNKLLGTFDDYRDLRTQLTTGPKEKKVRLPKPPSEVMEKLKLAGLKDMLDPTTLTAMGLGGLAGGTGIYLATRPKKGLGGKSSGEVDLENLVSAQKARGEEGASFPRRLKNRYVEFSKGLATDFRKSPGSAAAMGAITGATAGALAAKMLGAGK